MMQRPVMNPMFMDDAKPSKVKEPRWKRLARFCWRIVKLFFTDILRRRKEKLRVDIGTPWSRFMRGFLYRLMFVPTLIAVLVAVLVTTATHPKPAPAVMDPTSHGVYYDPVDLLSLDNTKLDAWLIPVVDARRVIIEKEDVLHRRYPAIVLVHDFGRSRQQMLPLVAPLHEAGFVLLVVNLRGAGPKSRVGSTFGLNESHDVRAAVELLRRRSFVDPDAIAVLGIGTGATASLLAAKDDGRIAALILDHPVKQFDDILAEHIGPRQGWLKWVRPMCKWTFEIAYKVDAEEMNLNRFSDLMRVKPTLLLDEPDEEVTSIKPHRVKQITGFLKKHVVAKRQVTTLIRKDSLGSSNVIELPADGGKSMDDIQWPPQQRAEEIVRNRRGG